MTTLAVDVSAVDPSVTSRAVVRCIACGDQAVLPDGEEFTCACGRSRAWCIAGDYELLGPCIAWGRGTGAVRRRRVPPLL